MMANWVLRQLSETEVAMNRCSTSDVVMLQAIEDLPAAVKLSTGTFGQLEPAHSDINALLELPPICYCQTAS